MSRSSHIIAFDPGKATGFTTYSPEFDSFASSELKDRHQFCEWMRANLNKNHFDVVVAEKFTISRRTITTKIDYSALNILGWVEHECYDRNISFIFQTPAQIKSTNTIATDENLKKIGWYTPTKGGHANDAARHMLVYLSTRSIGQPILKRITDAR